jgi:CRISPR-associated protein Cas1
MNTHANTLYVQTQGALLSRSGETVIVKIEKVKRLTVPIHHLDGIVCFGRVMVTPSLIELCADRDVAIAYLSSHGRLIARVTPAVSGNVLLRREQYRQADTPDSCIAIARCFVAAKIQNCRLTLLRAAREGRNRGGDEADGISSLQRAIDRLACSIDSLPQAASLDQVRGIEGEAARVYFEHFNLLIRQNADAFQMEGRSRRPPKDRVNALLSFVYAVLTHEMAAAVEAVGLDPAVGFLHADRPGRVSLALDLLEEFRTLIADRLVLSLINLKQVQPDGFEFQPGGAVQMTDATRRTVLAALTARKKDEVRHPLLEEKVSIGLLPHIQARLLARHLRGDLETYPALVLK